MNALTKPRSLSKTVAIASISLLAAGFVTALGISLQGLLWEIRNSQAALKRSEAGLVTALAEVQKAYAALEQARAMVQSAVENAKGTVAAATENARGQVLAAGLTARGMADAGRNTNIGEWETTAKLTNPLINNPSSRVTELGAALGRINYQLTKDVDPTGHPLTSEKRQQLEKERAIMKPQLELAQYEWLSALGANGEVVKDAATGLFGAIGLKIPAKSSTEASPPPTVRRFSQSADRN